MTRTSLHTADREGYEALWGACGLSYASWLVMPRAFMHAMPDEWQGTMARLIEEFWSTFDPWGEADVIVSLKRDGKFVSLQDWSSRQFYRHPNQSVIDSFRVARAQSQPDSDDVESANSKQSESQG